MDWEAYYADIRRLTNRIITLERKTDDLQCDLDKERERRKELERWIGDLQQAMAEKGE